MDDAAPSFDDVFRDEYPGIVRVLAPIVGSADEAEAVAQDAFLKAYARWSRVGRYDRPGAWVQRVAIRDAVRAARRLARSAGGGPSAGVAGTGPDPTEAVGRVDLWRALRRLPPQQRAAVVLHHLADWPTARVADALGCREATVRVHLHRARAALAADLGTGSATDREESTDGRR